MSLWKQGGEISKSYLLRHELRQQKGVHGVSGSEAAGEAPIPPAPSWMSSPGHPVSLLPLRLDEVHPRTYVDFNQLCSIFLLLDLRACTTVCVCTLGECVWGGL